MNDYTFMFYVHRWYRTWPEGTEGGFWTRPIDRIYMVRWRSKYGMDSQRVRARAVVAQWLTDKLRLGEIDRAEYNPQFFVKLGYQQYSHFLHRYSGHERGHPQIIRIEQPESMR